MEINADFSQRVVVHGDELDWQDSPIPGIQRKMFDRIGDEVARATSLVRYAPNSWFSPHVHSGGEEFIVLDGVFQDEHGKFPVGSYLRNPPQTQHTPGSEPGCVIFVKLWQFDPDDRNPVRLGTHNLQATAGPQRPGVSVIPLYQDDREDVRLEIWQPDAVVQIDTSLGAELLVLAGSFTESNDNLRSHSWLRMPLGSSIKATTGPNGVRVWVKTGHLRFVSPPIS